MMREQAIIIRPGKIGRLYVVFECAFCQCKFMRQKDDCENPACRRWETTCPGCDQRVMSNTLSCGGSELGRSDCGDKDRFMEAGGFEA